MTSEIRSDGGGGSAVQGTIGATVNGVGPQGTLKATFVKDGGFVNPADNVSGTFKGVGTARVVDNAKVTGAVDSQRSAAGVAANIGIAQVGVQVTTGTEEAKGVLSAIGDAIVEDVRQTIDSVKQMTSCVANSGCKP